MWNCDNEKDINLLLKIGCNLVRDDIRFSIFYKDTYDYKWLKLLNENNIRLIGILGFPGKDQFGDDYLVSSEEELKKYVQIITDVKNRFSNIYEIEVWNEPNWTIYEDETIKWYSKIVNETVNVFNNTKIIIGATTTDKAVNKNISSYDLFTKLKQFNVYKNSIGISFHSYDWNKKEQDVFHKDNLKTHRDFLEEVGGFIPLYISEFGANTSKYGTDENHQAELLIRQLIINDNYNVKESIIYGFRDTGTNYFDSENCYGIVRNDYTPKLSYYAIKNFLENTNGAEYIGTVDIENGLEAYVYDKDGKAKIIAWSNNTERNIEIPYQRFTAKDLYGKNIEPDENGNITITTSPVYLDNVDYNYFYQAISKVATTKYSQFKEKFANEIVQVPNLTNKIQQMENYVKNVGQTQNKILESASIEAMRMHYELGDLIIQAYKEDKLKVEYVKLSSMLDMLNDIGNSYEDLVTVSATATKPEFEQTNQLIQETEKLIECNQDLDIIYPGKILEFSKDCYEKATYIDSLEEENDIKSGLIISNYLHSKFLVQWANQFANLYIDEYIEKNPVTIEYSEINLTNKDVIAKLVTNAEIEILNNQNSKEITFVYNNTFTFKYKIKGREFTITAKVENIDKEPPIISGIEKGKIYTEKVTPIISDENLLEVKLVLDGEEIKDYIPNTKLIQEGFYEITAKDKAGNITSINFQLITNNDENYKITTGQIKNIKNNTTKSEFDKKLGLSISYEIFRNGKKIDAETKIATGDILKTQAEEEYTLIVAGDINKDGDVNIKDMIEMRVYLLKRDNLDEIQISAADCDLDGKDISIRDFIRMRIIILMRDIA